MADIENSREVSAEITSDINENFNTIKTLLNSIRAQGILNTSDVDKLLTGINTKLQKLDTEEDIDLIKVFLSELKQTLDERHNVLISKFGAIESLFSNLLKNSNELPKSAELKELFDIVATNLSVFSREVVSQKESLTDIALKLDAIRSDDTDKKDIIKNITLLKPDLERLNNGFDSIVLSLNDNFKTIIKTISTIDKTEHLDKFSESLSKIEMSSNTVLSALQMIDKKTEQVDETLKSVLTKDDITPTNQRISELTAQSQILNDAISSLSDKYVRIDNLADKIDASVNIIASLKSVLEETDDKNTKLVLDDIKTLDEEVRKITSDTKFEEFKTSFEGVLNKLIESSANIDTDLKTYIEDAKAHISLVADKSNTLNEASIARVLDDISSNAESLTSRLSNVQSELIVLCEKNFNSVQESVSDLKTIVSQIDENDVSANSAIFENITDRLNVFENALKNTLDTQERTVSESSGKLVERIEDIKNISNMLDYKMDSSVVEIGNVKRGFDDLKSSVESVLALDFVNTVKDLRADLYASKQEMMNSFENSSNEISDKFSNDLYSKYELLISKLDSTEDDLRKIQLSSLEELKPVLDKMSASIVDVLSYVSETKSDNTDSLDSKLNEITDIVKETNMNYVEHVRDIVDVIRTQVENNLKNISEDNERQIESLKNTAVNNAENIINSISDNSRTISEGLESLKEKSVINAENIIKSISDNRTAIDDNLNSLKENSIQNAENIINSISDNRTAIGDGLNSLKENSIQNAENIINTISDSQTAINAGLDTIKEKSGQNVESIKAHVTDAFNSTNEVITKSTETILNGSQDLKNDIKYSYSKLLEIQDLYGELKALLTTNDANSSNKLNDVVTAAGALKDDINIKIINLRDAMLDKISDFKQDFTNESINKADEFKASFENTASNNLNEIKSVMAELKDQVDKFSTDNSGARTAALAKILDNFVSLKEYASKLNDDYSDKLTQKVNELIEDFSSVRAILNKVDENVDGDMTRQLSIIESNFETLISQITILFEKADKDLSDRIYDEFADISDKMQAIVTEKLETYKYKVEESFDNLQKKAEEQTDYLQDRIANLNSVLKGIWEEQAKDNLKQIDTISDKLKDVLKENLKMSEIDYLSLKDRINEFAENITADNNNLTQDLKTQFDEITQYVDSVLGVQAQDIATKQDELKEIITNKSDVLGTVQNDVKSQIEGLGTSIEEKLGAIKSLTTELSTNELSAMEAYIDSLKEQVELQIQAVTSSKNAIVQAVNAELKNVSGEIEKETDTVIAELIDQFELLKKSQADDVVSLSSKVEELVSAQIYNNIEDLKSYLDIKTDNSVLSSKLDNLKNELVSSIKNVMSDLGRMLDSGVFNSAIADFRLANEMLVNSAIDRMNDKIESFINENIKTIADVLTDDSKKIEDKLALFDKKFVDTVVDKFEEIKLISNSYNNSLDDIQKYINDVVSEFNGVKSTISTRIDALADKIQESAASTNAEIRNLNDCFEKLRSQISSKSFDEAFQLSINKQISNLEDLIGEQLGYIEDINELCMTSLPDISEISTLVKGSIAEKIEEFSEKFNSQDIEGTIEKEVKQLKTDIISQILNVFNQISFVAEQEEIIDFIQDKHDELINVLSRIVPATDKINSVKADIEHLNNKINAIISSDGDIDYIYSLQDLESDIANLRLVLNEMKENTEGNEFSELLNSTNDIYKLVESIKTELPTRDDFNGISEDIVSISSRTNKLLLSSEESYKMIQDNLNEFKLVVDDLDERTRNFARESGMDKVNAKLNALNEMVQSGSKTNQVFNQVFEYLAEWIDSASFQINTIADKVESLDDIGQIKDILIGLKSDAEDDTETAEMAEALSTIFDKQNKRMTSIETKLDKLIVDNTVKKKGKSDISPMETTLNKFLLAMDEKFTAQQDKINSLESKLSSVMSLLDEKDTVQLTKKVGGMDRQIAKLNKSIEKIASHVVEK